EKRGRRSWFERRLRRRTRSWGGGRFRKGGEAPPSYLAGDRERAAPWIGAGPARVVGPDAHDAHRARTPLELGPLGDDVAEGRERVTGLAWNPPLDLHLAGGHRVRP